jgi:hypothetical protein
LSKVRFTLLGRAIGAFVLVAAALAGAQSCGFPDHQFVSDEEFNARGKSGEHPVSGLDASAGGGDETGGRIAVGAGGTNGGNGGSNRGGVGGSVMVRPREGGVPMGDGGAADGAASGGTDGEDSGMPCPPGLSVCGGVCVDLQTDLAHCGDCAMACASGQVCASGKCGAPCSMSLTACTPPGGTEVCVDIKSDQGNCGGCNRPCTSPPPPAAQNVCQGGQCLVDCGSFTRCGTECYDTTKDDTHCGGCSTNCTLSGQVCSGGQCKTSCTSPFVSCNNTCVNLTSDNQNCGMCGKACTAPQGCVGGACKTLVENCLNGTDDDRDGLVDCADPDCGSGYTCASVPVGWQGPVVLWTGTVNTAPACPTSYPSQVFLAHNALSVPSYNCPSCTCTPMNAACGLITLSFDITSNCSAQAAWTGYVSPKATCQPEYETLKSAMWNPNSLPMGSVQLAQPLPASGSCTPSPVDATIPAPTWGADAQACGGASIAGAGCAIGQCLPKPSSPYGSSVCVFRSGVSSCPSSYPKPSGQNGQFYADFTDQRSCTQCSCGGVSCGQLGLSTSFDNTKNTCAAPSVNVPMDGSCVAIPASQVVQGTETEWMTWTNGSPSCGKGTSALVGAATPADPITVCCQ